MGWTRALAATFLGGVVAATLAAGAAAASPEHLTVSPTTVSPGGAVTISGKCTQNKADIWYENSADDKLGGQKNVSGDKNDDGYVIAASLTIGTATTPGSYKAVMKCEGDDDVAEIAFTVSSGGSNAGGGAAAAEDNTMLIAGGGLFTAAAIAGAMVWQRRSSVAAS